MTPSRFDHTAEVSLSRQLVTPARDHSRSQSRNPQVDEDGEVREAFNFFSEKFNNKHDTVKTTKFELAAVVMSRRHNSAFHN